MTGTRRRILRLTTAAVFVLVAVVSSLPASVAAPSKSDVEAAKAKLAELNRTTGLLVEEYNQAKLALEQTRARLADLRQTKADADAAKTKALADLERRAVSAYTGMGSELDAILGASTFADFTDRIQYMGALAETDEDLAAAADAASEQARWAAAEVSKTLAEEVRQRDALQTKITAIRDAVSEQQALYEKLNKDYHDALAARRAAAAAAEQALQGVDSGGSGGGWGGFTPPPNTAAAQVAILAAKSVLGVPYVWGAADPNVGFDCSGLTSWAWGQAGVYLPHSSQAQYDYLPHVDASDIAPGDILFFYTPISHVGLFTGGNTMIAAPHTGTVVQYQSIDWGNVVGVGRPG
ncbi:MAG TPA: NlpC/P60 family protein [Actinomycetota bacterium]|jgi:cell wall-associated NlpC family hydrolase|nr:NlpC/P60 family protein [Actinomycetota bacterium]